MALFGWLNAQQAAVYTRKANRKRLEADAAPLLQGRNMNEKSPTFPSGHFRWDNWTKKLKKINARILIVASPTELDAIR